MNIKKFIALSFLTVVASSHIFAESPKHDKKEKVKKMGANPYTYAPIFFTADNGITGRYWAGNKQYPGKAFLEEEEYSNIVVIKKSKIHEKLSKKLRKHKDYLGFYVNTQTNIAYNLYGNKKNPDTVNENPDADVITMIAMKEDFGIDE